MIYHGISFYDHTLFIVIDDTLIAKRTRSFLSIVMLLSFGRITRDLNLTYVNKASTQIGFKFSGRWAVTFFEINGKI